MNAINRELSVGGVTLPSIVFLAPMAGVSDYAYRHLVQEISSVTAITEMVSVKALHYKSEKTPGLMKPTSGFTGIQVFGRDVEIFKEVLPKICSEYNPSFIDINMGCPAPKIVKNGEGSALMLEPELVGKIVATCVKHSSVPITVKMRKGFSKDSINATLISRIVQEEGASMVTIHGRTREQYYSGEADWEIIGEVKARLKIPVIGNGDVSSPERALEMLEKTGCDGVMVGRAAEGNPFILKQIKDYLEKGSYRYYSLEERINAIRRHTELIIGDKGERIGMLEMRKHLAWYTRGVYDGARLRKDINSISTLKDLLNILSLLEKSIID